MRATFFLIALAVSPIVAQHAAPTRPLGWLGIGYEYNDTSTPSARRVWLFVQQVAPGSPAEYAGLKPQDVITAINGRTIWFRNEREALNFFGGVRVGEAVLLMIKRGRELRRLSLIAGNMPAGIAQLRKNNQQIVKAHEAAH